MRVLPTSIKSITSKIAAVVLGCSMLVAPGLIASAQAVTTPSTLVTFETTDTTGYALGAGADFNGNTFRFQPHLQREDQPVQRNRRK